MLLRYELLAGFLKRPYSTGPNTRSYSKQYGVIRAAGGKFPLPSREPPISAEATDLLQKLLAFKPSERISAEASLQHAWLVAVSPIVPLDRAKSVSAVVRSESAMASISSFARLSPLQRLAFDAMAFTMSPKRLSELRKTFNEVPRIMP